MHDQQMISLSDEIVRDKGMGPMAVDATLAIEDFFARNSHRQCLAVFRFTEWAAQYGGLYMLKIGNGNA
jgi:hypothetical protein